MNQFLDKWLRKTLWLWLPIVAMVILFRQLGQRLDQWEKEKERR